MPKPSKRDQFVEVTKELLWEVGYEAMSPRDIQARSAARPGSLYHHFPSKPCDGGGAWGKVKRPKLQLRKTANYRIAGHCGTRLPVFS
jgi:hypothetical protein